jgi:hypothetical protein
VTVEKAARCEAPPDMQDEEIEQRCADVMSLAEFGARECHYAAEGCLYIPATFDAVTYSYNIYDYSIDCNSQKYTVLFVGGILMMFVYS